MCMFTPDQTNQRGDKLSVADLSAVSGKRLEWGGGAHLVDTGGVIDPSKRGEMLFNWLTGGGLPKTLDPSKIFGDAQKASGVQAAASAGQGFSGLFGIGNKIGDLVPKPVPLNQSPMQTGVPYSTTPIPKLGK